MSQSREDAVAGLYAAFGRGDVPAVLSGIDQEIEWRSPENLPVNAAVSLPGAHVPAR